MNLFAEGGPPDHPVFQRPVPGDLPTPPGLAAEVLPCPPWVWGFWPVVPKAAWLPVWPLGVNAFNALTLGLLGLPGLGLFSRCPAAPPKSPSRQISQRKVILHAPQLLSHPLPPVPDRPGSAGSPVFRRGALRRFSPAVRPGGVSPPPSSAGVRSCICRRASTPPSSAPAEDLSLPEENDPFQGVFLSLDQLADAQTLADGYDGVILPMKTADGALGYVSCPSPLAADAGASSGDPDRNEALRALNDTPGLYTVAQVSCLRDSALVREEPGLSLHRVSGSPWLDESRQGWLDPRPAPGPILPHRPVPSWLQLGFDEILLTDCGFPTQGDLIPSAPWRRRRKPWRPSAASSRAPWLTRLSPCR